MSLYLPIIIRTHGKISRQSTSKKKCCKKSEVDGHWTGNGYLSAFWLSWLPGKSVDRGDRNRNREAEANFFFWIINTLGN